MIWACRRSHLSGWGAGPSPAEFCPGPCHQDYNGDVDPSPKRRPAVRGIPGRGCETGCFLSRCPMTLMMGLAIAWSILTAVLVILLIYRSTLTMHEDDQLFLSDANSQMQQDQTELLVKVNRLRLPVWVVGAGSGVLLLVIGGMLIYQKLNEMQ